MSLLSVIHSEVASAADPIEQVIISDGFVFLAGGDPLVHCVVLAGTGVFHFGSDAFSDVD